MSSSIETTDLESPRDLQRLVEGELDASAHTGAGNFISTVDQVGSAADLQRLVEGELDASTQLGAGNFISTVDQVGDAATD